MQTSPPETGADIQFAVADFEETASDSVLNSKEGWRVAGLYLDLHYGGGLQDDTLFCGDNEVEVSLEAPNGSAYTFGPAFLTEPRCVFLVPETNVRLYLQGYVPQMLPTLEGSLVTVKVGPSDGYGVDPIHYENTMSLRKGIPFGYGSSASGAQPFGSPVSFQKVGYEGQVQKGTYEFATVRESASMFVTAKIVYRLTNQSGHDLWSPLTRTARVSGTLIDAQGAPYQIVAREDCVVPPGHTQECVLDAVDGYSPVDEPPDLSDVVIIIRPETGESYVLRGSGQ